MPPIEKLRIDLTAFKITLHQNIDVFYIIKKDIFYDVIILYFTQSMRKGPTIIATIFLHRSTFIKFLHGKFGQLGRVRSKEQGKIRELALTSEMTIEEYWCFLSILLILVLQYILIILG